MSNDASTLAVGAPWEDGRFGVICASGAQTCKDSQDNDEYTRAGAVYLY